MVDARGGAGLLSVEEGFGNWRLMTGADGLRVTPGAVSGVFSAATTALDVVFSLVGR
jgi:hypothetical protein